MKSIVVFFVIALIPGATIAAHAKNVTTDGTSNEKSVSGVAGPTVAAHNSSSSGTDNATIRHPSKKALKKTKITSPPPMHDPN
jgi:hypothetical protein